MEEIVTSLPAGSIKPGINPRTYFDPAEMAELEESVKAKGVLQPILVRRLDDGYQVIAGHRRLAAAQKVLGNEYQIPVYVREMDDSEADEAALTENVARANMSPTEEAEAAAKILGRCGGDRDEAAKRLGWSRSTLDKRLALMNCSDSVRKALTERKIQIGHAELLATATKEKQDQVLTRLLGLPSMPPIAQFKAQLEQISKSLDAAIFNKIECVGCQFNSGNQQALFSEAIKDGHCTNGQCYDTKTLEELDIRGKSLAEEYPSVKIVQPGENFTIVKIVAEGELGVGEEQAKACRGCQNFGAAISNIPGKIGNVYRDQCFDPACNTQKVAARLKAEKEAKTTEKATATAATASTGKTAAAKPAAKSAKPNVTVQDSQRVKDYRVKVWRKALRMELFADPERNLIVLLALAICGEARCISTTKLRSAFQKLTGTEANGSDITVMASQLVGTAPDIRTQLLNALAPSVEGELGEHNVVRVLTFMQVDLGKHWQLNEEYLGLLTKSEIEAMADEIGLQQHMGKENFSKLMGKKKDEIVKGLLAVDGFDYQGKVPKAMQYAK